MKTKKKKDKKHVMIQEWEVKSRNFVTQLLKIVKLIKKKSYNFLIK